MVSKKVDRKLLHNDQGYGMTNDKIQSFPLKGVEQVKKWWYMNMMFKLPSLIAIPMHFHGIERLRLQDGANERVHLGHVAAEPEQPAAGPSDHKHHLRRTCYTLLRMRKEL